MIRLAVIIFISLVPFLRARLFFYRILLGFKIGKNVKIAMLNLLDIRKLTMDDGAEIRGIGNVFLNVSQVEMGKFSRIGGARFSLNFFRGTAHKKGYPRSVLRIGKCSIIELFHYFDLCADITIGDNVVIGGIKSIFFTHTFYKTGFEPIIIGDNVFIGSSCLFQMGVIIRENCVIGMGSVVVKSIESEDSLIGGNPAKAIKEHFGFNAAEALRLRQKPFVENGKCIVPPHYSECR
jgi:acetyltransferase-like isoleucine patch superfamily enzyme